RAGASLHRGGHIAREPAIHRIVTARGLRTLTHLVQRAHGDQLEGVPALSSARGTSMTLRSPAIVMRRGFACSGFGTRSLSTPAPYSALMLALSTPGGTMNVRTKRPCQRSER